jgi:glutathione transport system substrate-binding protein
MILDECFLIIKKHKGGFFMRKWMSRFLVLLFGVVLTSSCIVSSAGKTTLNFGLSSEPPSLKPAIIQGQAKRTVLLCIYRGLLGYNSKTGSLINELAKSYTLAPDNKTYTFKLRNAKFHNGDPVTANDVKYTFERIIDPKSGALYGNQRFNVAKMVVVNSKTIKVTLTEPNTPFIQYLALPESGIISKKWAEEHNGNLNAYPMGAGPFKFVSWNKGQNITLKKFKGYYKKGYPKVDTLKFSFFANDDARTNAIRSGDVDIIEYVPWKDMIILEKDSGIKLLSSFGPYMSVAFNTNYKPFSNPKVRQAIAYAVDRKKVINTAFCGRGKVLFGLPIQKTDVGYDKKFDSYFSHNIAKAKALLKEAGYANGFKVRLLSSSSYAMHQQTAVSVQDDLKKLGIEVTLDLPDWANRNKKALAGEYDAFIVGTAADFTDPDWLSNYFVGEDNNLNKPAGFNDPELNKLFDKGRILHNKAQRQAIYQQLYQKMLDLSPAVFLAWREQSYAVRSNVTGFVNFEGALTFYSPNTIERTVIK